MVTFPVVTESRVVSETSRPVLGKTCMSIMTRPVKPSHMEECLPAVFGIRGGLGRSLVPMVPLGVDSRETDDTVPNDFLVPPGIPEEGLVHTSDGESETLSVAAVPSVGDVAGAVTREAR